MGNKARSAEDMQTLPLSCQLCSRGRRSRARGLRATQGGVWAGLGGLQAGLSERTCQKPSLCLMGFRSANPRTPWGLILQPLGRTHGGNVCGEG